MNELQNFNNDEFGKIRVTIIDGKEMFVANDVAKALGYSNISDAISRHCRSIVKHDIPHPQSKNKTIQANMITEGDMYRLITHSKLPSAEKFESWVFDEVLPTIRKHGAYMTTDTLEQAIGNPDFMIGLLEALKDERAEKERLQAKVEEQKPLVEFAETVANTKDYIDMNEMAKVCNDENLFINGKTIGRNKLYDWLRDKGYIMKNSTLPYQKHVENQLFKVVEVVKNTAYGSKTNTKTLISGKGQIKIVEMIREENKNKDQE